MLGDPINITTCIRCGKEPKNGYLWTNDPYVTSLHTKNEEHIALEIFKKDEFILCLECITKILTEEEEC